MARGGKKEIQLQFLETPQLLGLVLYSVTSGEVEYSHFSKQMHRDNRLICLRYFPIRSIDHLLYSPSSYSAVLVCTVDDTDSIKGGHSPSSGVPQLH